MDKKTADTVEAVTEYILEEALADRDVECDVVVASQRLIEFDEANSTDRRLRVKRKLTSGLAVDLDLSCTATRNGDKTDIKELLLTEINTKVDDYRQQLADNASFFSQYNQRVEQKLTDSAISGQEQTESGQGKLIGIIVGCAISVLVFVVSLYMARERRSNRRASRIINQDGNGAFELRSNREALQVIHDEKKNEAYDLNAIAVVNSEAEIKSKSHKSESRKEIVSQSRSTSEASKSKSKSKGKVRT